MNDTRSSRFNFSCLFRLLFSARHRFFYYLFYYGPFFRLLLLFIVTFICVSFLPSQQFGLLPHSDFLLYLFYIPFLFYTLLWCLVRHFICMLLFLLFTYLLSHTQCSRHPLQRHLLIRASICLIGLTIVLTVCWFGFLWGFLLLRLFISIFLLYLATTLTRPTTMLWSFFEDPSVFTKNQIPIRQSQQLLLFIVQQALWTHFKRCKQLCVEAASFKFIVEQKTVGATLLLTFCADNFSDFWPFFTVFLKQANQRLVFWMSPPARNSTLLLLNILILCVLALIIRL